MINNKTKKNARPKGAGSTLNLNSIDFINTGHAAQARYVAAMANPFAAPPVPIPDSFLVANVAKVAKEAVLSNVTALEIEFYKSSHEPTGDYTVKFSVGYADGTGTVLKQASSEVGARLVAAGIAFEDAANAADVGGIITYRQTNSAYDPTTGVTEIVSVDERSERNYGYGSLVYQLSRRQAMSFEDNGYTYLRVQFQQSTNLVARFAAIVESDGKQGFVEDVVSDSDFLITNQMTNHHAGVFGDTPMPDLGTHLEPAITSPEKGHTSAWHKTWASAGHWVASAAGWLWKHRGEVYNAARAGSAIYRNLTSFAGSITGMGNGEIMSLPARAAPLLLAAP